VLRVDFSRERKKKKKIQKNPAVHPSEWRTPGYTLGSAEHDIDIAMPFGKANSPKKKKKKKKGKSSAAGHLFGSNPA